MAGVDVCGGSGGGQRERHVYTSTSDAVEIFVVDDGRQHRDSPDYFVLRYQGRRLIVIAIISMIAVAQVFLEFNFW